MERRTRSPWAVSQEMEVAERQGIVVAVVAGTRKQPAADYILLELRLLVELGAALEPGPELVLELELQAVAVATLVVDANIRPANVDTIETHRNSASKLQHTCCASWSACCWYGLKDVNCGATAVNWGCSWVYWG